MTPHARMRYFIGSKLIHFLFYESEVDRRLLLHVPREGDPRPRVQRTLAADRNELPESCRARRGEALSAALGSPRGHRPPVGLALCGGPRRRPAASAPRELSAARGSRPINAGATALDIRGAPRPARPHPTRPRPATPGPRGSRDAAAVAFVSGPRVVSGYLAPPARSRYLRLGRAARVLSGNLCTN